MKCLPMRLLAGAFSLLAAASAYCGVAYPDPVGGWTYIYNGDKDTFGNVNAFDSLDGTWSKDNGSASWDGSKIGGAFNNTDNHPGGVMTITESNVTYLRIQDTGDPRDYPEPGGSGNYTDPSNRKIYFGHNIETDGGSPTVLNDGITLSFRARIPTTNNTTFPLDPLHRDGQGAAGIQPYPAGGDGYVTSDGGKGNFVIKQGAGASGAIAFSLTQTNDTPGGDPNANRANFAGLTMNEFAGNQISGNVNFGQGSATNVIPFNPTEWHELWIVLRKDPANVGTHQGFIYRDGSLNPIIFRITAGNGSDYDQSYLAIGSTATPQTSALDIDFVAYKLGVNFPPGAFDNLPPEIVNVSPARGALFYSATNGVSFDASTQGTNTLPTSGFKLILNGADVSSGLNVTGSATNRTARYTNLTANTAYTGQIIVSDQAGRSSTNALAFDTFVEATSVVVEAEDYNFLNGLFADNSPPAGFDGARGTSEIDYHDNNTAPNTIVYRIDDFVGIVASTDIARQRFTSAGATDYMINAITAGDWLNYTRTFSNNTYNVFLRASSTAPQSVRLDRVTGDLTTTNQNTFQLGVFSVPNTGSANSFTYVSLTDAAGNPVALRLSGTNSLRLTALAASGNLQYNFLLFAPAAGANQPPYLSAVSPGVNESNVAPNAVVRVTVANGTTQVAPGSVTLSFNGSNVTSAASMVTSASGVQLTYDPPGLLAVKTAHTVSLVFSDTGGASFTNQWTFRTLPFNPIITSLVETDGDGPPTAKSTGQTFDVLNGPAGYTVPPFGEDVLAFTDRVHQWNGASTTLPIPAYLAGGEYIMIRNDNRENPTLKLDVTVSEAAVVYVLVDNRLTDGDGATPPDFSSGSMSWLLQNGWTAVTNGLNRSGNRSLPDEVAYDEGGDGVGPGVGLNQFASVYLKNVPAGAFSLLQADNAGNNMYGVVVKPASGLVTPPVFSKPSLNGTTLTITWTGGGTLQEASDASGPYTNVAGNPQGTFTTQATGIRKFYRAVVP